MNTTSIFVVGRGGVGTSITRNLQDNGYEPKVFHSQNIHEAYGQEPDILIYAGVPGVKWLANKDSAADAKLLGSSLKNFDKINAKQTILISTIDAGYSFKTDENYSEYGSNRESFENLVRMKYELRNKHLGIVRLPALMGEHIQKNVYYDLHNPHPSHIQLGALRTIKSIEKLLKEKNGLKVVSQSGDTFEVEWNNSFGMPLLTHPQSIMTWLNIDNLGMDILNRIDELDGRTELWIDAKQDGEPLSLTTESLVRRYSGKDMPVLENSEDYSAIMNKVDYSDLGNVPDGIRVIAKRSV